MSIYRIKMNGHTYEMEVELLEANQRVLNQSVQKTAISHNSVEQTDVKEKKETKVGPNTVVAPMPGSVIEIMANEGDSVSKHEGIMILEAMKMENDITAPKTGTIKRIYVHKGQTVATGDPLFELEA